MKKGIIMPFFKNIDVKDRLDAIKKVGFNTFMISLDRNYEKITAPIEEIVDYCKQIGLEIYCGHAPYMEPEVISFWSNSKLGDQIEKQYLQNLKLASKCNIKTVVFHLHNGADYKLCEAGINRLKRLVNYAEEHNINIAIENLYSYDELGYIFDKIKSANLGMCYDSGHENFLTKNAGFLQKYGHRLKAVHLHDNDGATDQHKTPFTGTIDWKNVAFGLANSKEVPLEAEVKLYKEEGRDEYTKKELYEILKTQFEAVEKLEKLIEESKVLVANNSI